MIALLIRGDSVAGLLNESTFKLIIILCETTESVFTAGETSIRLPLEADALLKNYNAMPLKRCLLNAANYAKSLQSSPGVFFPPRHRPVRKAESVVTERCIFFSSADFMKMCLTSQ